MSEELPEKKRIEVAVNAIKDLNLSIRYIDDESNKEEDAAAQIEDTNVDENMSNENIIIKQKIPYRIIARLGKYI